MRSWALTFARRGVVNVVAELEDGLLLVEVCVFAEEVGS